LKDLQQQTGSIAALSRFMSRVEDKDHRFFQFIKKVKAFKWTKECEEAFKQIKAFLESPPVLAQPGAGKKLILYLSTSELAVSVVLVREERSEQQPIYFVSRLLQGAEVRYQLIEKIVLALIMAARKLR
jgi:hypothetical protein